MSTILFPNIPLDLLISNDHSFLLYLSFLTLIKLQKILLTLPSNPRLLSFISSLIFLRKTTIPWNISLEYEYDKIHDSFIIVKSETKIGTFFNYFIEYESIPRNNIKTTILQGVGSSPGLDIFENILSTPEGDFGYVSYIISDTILIPRNFIKLSINPLFTPKQLFKSEVIIGNLDSEIDNNLNGETRLYTFTTESPLDVLNNNVTRKRAYSNSSMTSVASLNSSMYSLNLSSNGSSIERDSDSSSGNDPDNYPFLDENDEFDAVFSESED